MSLPESGLGCGAVKDSAMAESPVGFSEIGRPGAESDGIGGSTANVKFRVSTFPRASETLTAKLDDPIVVGIPSSDPPVVSLKPAGNAPLLTTQNKGGVPPVA